MASILQNPESLLFSIKVSWCICLVSHALALHTLGFVMPLWTSFHLSMQAPLLETPELAPPPWLRLISGVLHSLFSLSARSSTPWLYCIWMTPNQYRRLSPHLYWIQISLFNHRLIRSLGSLLGTWPEMKLWSWLSKITFSISVKVPPRILFKPYIWKSFSLLHSLSQLSVTSSHSTSSYTQNLVNYLHLNDTSPLHWHIPPTWQQSMPVCLPASTLFTLVLNVLYSKTYIFHILTHLKLEYILQSVDGILKLHWFCFSFF